MRLISFLGTGQYGTTHYTFNEQQCETCYVAAALSQFIKPDEIIILATTQAKQKHETGLCAEIERLNLPQPHFELIPSGGNQEELWQQFEIICQAITKESPESVTLDITHGFRAQPFFAASIIAYLHAIERKPKNFKVYYGEFRENEVESPFWDISVFITLLDWSSALHSFIKTGHGDALAQLAIDENKRIQKSSSDSRPRMLKSLADSLHAFSANLATVRCPQIITGEKQARGSARNVLKLIEDSAVEVKTHLKPLAPVLDGLREQLQNIPADSLFGKSGHHALSALAKLYLQYERYPEALITAREGWISLYAEKDQSDKELLAKDKRKCTEARWYEAEKMSKGPPDITNPRNDIEHGGFREQPLSAEKLREQTEKLVNDFINAQPKQTVTMPIGKTYFISRHPGAFAWAEAQGFHVDECLEHFDVNKVQRGDIVIGTLPVNLIAEVNKRGGRYFHLSLELSAETRGKELSAEEMQTLGAQLKEFKATQI